MTSLREQFVFVTDSEIGAFLEEWQREANTLKRCFDERGAALIERLADELRIFLRAKANETISVADASRASRFSEDHLRRQLSVGALPNRGVSGKPRVRRGDLRPKGNASLAQKATDSYDVAADVRSLQIRRGE